MKFTIEQHKQHLINQEYHLKGKKNDIDRLSDEYCEHKQRVDFFKAQIDLAIKEKKDGFDTDKYAIKRLCV